MIIIVVMITIIIVVVTCVINCSAFCLLHGPALLVEPEHVDNDDDDDDDIDDDDSDDDDEDDSDEDDGVDKDDDYYDGAGGLTDYNPNKVFELRAATDDDKLCWSRCHNCQRERMGELIVAAW